MIYGFLFFLGGFLAIGIYSATQKKSTSDDYLLAGREVNPWLTALSAVSTTNSGFMFIGLVGITYVDGLSSMWLMIGWISGDYLAWLCVYRRFRQRSEEMDTATIPSFLAASSKGDVARPIAVVAAIITLLFLGTYAAAQLTAGSKALHEIFGWDYRTGTLMGAAIVAIYCFSGGIRASIWTDAVQAIVMLASMLYLLLSALTEIGGFSGLQSQLAAIDPALVDWHPQNIQFGFGLYLVGWVFAGVGVLGQPHIMIRAMAIDSIKHIGKARRIYFTWYVAFSIATILVGLCCRVLLPVEEHFDAELSLPRLSQMLLPDVAVGFMLAGLFAATISTADSQILSCSAALTQDLFPRWGKSYTGTKIGTLVVTVLIVMIVFAGNKSVFDLVVLSWSALAAGMGPLLVVRALGRPVTTGVAVAMMLTGLSTVFLWKYVLEFSGSLYEILPGMAAGFVVYFIYLLAYGFRTSRKTG